MAGSFDEIGFKFGDIVRCTAVRSPDSSCVGKNFALERNMVGDLVIPIDQSDCHSRTPGNNSWRLATQFEIARDGLSELISGYDFAAGREYIKAQKVESDDRG